MLLSNLPTRVTLLLPLPSVQHFVYLYGKVYNIVQWLGFAMGGLKCNIYKNTLLTHKLKMC